MTPFDFCFDILVDNAKRFYEKYYLKQIKKPPQVSLIIRFDKYLCYDTFPLL